MSFFDFLTKPIKLAVFLTLFLLFIFSFFTLRYYSKPIIYLEIDESVESFWKTLVLENPLPKNIHLVFDLEKMKGQTKARLKLFEENGPRSSFDQKNNPAILPNARSFLVKETLFAPIVPFYDFRYSLSLKEPQDRKTTSIVDIDTIPFPYRALRIDEMEIDNPDYPLRFAIRLHWQAESSKKSLLQKIVSKIFLIQKKQNAVFAEMNEWLDNLARLEPKPQSIFRIGAVGDLLPSRGSDSLLRGKNGLKTVFGSLLAEMQEVDLLLGNLEGPVSLKGSPATKSYTFRFSPDILPHLVSAGFDYLSLANNHSFDFGETAFLDSFTHFEKNAIGTAGVGKNLKEAQKPWLFPLSPENMPIRVLSMSAWPREKNGFDGVVKTAVHKDRPGVLWIGNQDEKRQEEAFAALNDMSANDGFSIVMIHGGEEWGFRPDNEQRILYKKIADAGANLILGAHSHVLQGMEAFSNSLIVYSLGNFLFPGMQETNGGEESMLLVLGIYKGSILYVKPIPAKLQGQKVDIDRSGKILKRFQEETKFLCENP